MNVGIDPESEYISTPDLAFGDNEHISRVSFGHAGDLAQDGGGAFIGKGPVQRAGVAAVMERDVEFRSAVFRWIWNPFSGSYQSNQDETCPTILSSICDGSVSRALQAQGCGISKEQGLSRA